MEQIKGRQRIIIQHVNPEIDCGKFPVKRTVGEHVKVEADVFSDGHDSVAAALMYRKKGAKKWMEAPMQFIINDRWKAQFKVDETGWYEYTIQGWVDHFSTWQKGLKLKYEAGQKIDVELQIGAELVAAAKKQASPAEKKQIDALVVALKKATDPGAVTNQVMSDEVTEMMARLGERADAATYDRILTVDVERKKALFSSWYEIFPRSTAEKPGSHGTFKTVERTLPLIAKMGFDVLYFPPIHPIGRSFRKGKDNSPTAEPGEPGSPWAIGAREGGHKAIHPELGTLQDFKRLVKKANEAGLEIALDLAYQCSPDHPYVKEHPQWFKWRPDGTVQYAENPPKKYQDVLPINFENDDWQNLWKELKSVVDYWIEQGVRIFRVDNPHTKPFRFWQWLIAGVRKDHPDSIFLAEAFTRPRVMQQLGKIGFTQSYTYFTWRNSRWEFIEYLNELTKSEMREYYRPNFWPNTPDILPESLQYKNEAAFLARLVLAATMSSNYGVYGPVFDFGLNVPHPAREEYKDNEKYEIKHWDWTSMNRIREAMARINRIRKENPALQTTWNIYFAESQNDQLLCYGKTDDEKKNKIFVAVNLDSEHMQSSWIRVPVHEMGISIDRTYRVYDLMADTQYTWNGEWNYVELHPQIFPAHVFKVEQD